MTGSQSTQKQGGTTSGTSTTASTASPEMSDFVNYLKTNIIQPLTSSFMPQMLEALKTGGAPNAQIPLVQNAVSSLRKGASNVTTGIKNMLASSGLLNTPFGQRILAQTAQSTEEQASSVSPNVAAGLISGAPGMISGASGQVISGLSGTGTKTTTGSSASTGTGGGSVMEAGGTASAAGGLLASLAPSLSSLLPFGAAAGGGVAATAGGFGAGGIAATAGAGALGAGLDTSLLELAPLALMAL